jgi:preprotein translocase subunit SecG
MVTALMIILAIASALLVVCVLMQPGNSDGLSGSIAGGAEQLFGKKKARGYETILHRATIVFIVIIVVLSLVIGTIQVRG